MSLQINYGNREGRYFTQWRFDLLAELLQKIHDGFFPNSPKAPIANAEIWYDDEQDFHRLSFQTNGHAVEIRLYKAFASKIDGKDHWVGCPKYDIWAFAASIRKQLEVERNYV